MTQIKKGLHFFFFFDNTNTNTVSISKDLDLKQFKHILYGCIKAYESGWDILTAMVEVHGVEGDVVILLLYTD